MFIAYLTRDRCCCFYNPQLVYLALYRVLCTFVMRFHIVFIGCSLKKIHSPNLISEKVFLWMAKMKPVGMGNH